MSFEPHRIERSVDQLRRQFALAPPDRLERIRARWPELVGDAQAAVSTPSGLRDGVLTVTTTEPAVIEALKWSGARVVAALADDADPVVVERVRGVLEARR